MALSSVEKAKILVLQWRARSKARERAKEVFDFVDKGDQIEKTPRMPGEDSAHQRAKLRYAPNFGRLAVDRLSYLYSVPPIRVGADAEAWSAVWDRHPLMMLEGDRSVRLGGTSLLVGTVGDKGVEFSILPRHRWEAIASEEDPGAVGAAIYHERTLTGEDGRKVEVFRFIDDVVSVELRDAADYREAEALAEYVALAFEAEGEDLEHGAGRCPAATLKNTPNLRGLFGRPLGGHDFLTNLITVNRKFEELVWTSILQRGQPVRRNAPRNKAGQDAIAPDIIIDVDANGDFDFKGNAANLDGMSMVLQLMLDSLARTLHLPRDAFAIKSIQPANSAAVIQASDAELKADRQLRTQIASQWEEQIVEIGAALDPTLGLDVRTVFSTAPLPLTHAEKIAEAKLELENRLSPREDILRELKPHLTPAESMERIEKASEEADRDTERRALIAGRINDGTDTSPGVASGGTGDPDASPGDQDQ